MRHVPSINRPTSIVYTILLISFIYTLHLTLPMYVASSFLSTFTNEKMVGLLYMAGSIFTVLGLFFIGKILTRWGNYRTALALIIIEAVLFYGFITAKSFTAIAIIFIISTAVVALIGLTMDVFLETYSEVNNTGGIRGMYMAINNIAWILAPLLSAALLAGLYYRNVYVASFALLFILLYLVYKNLRKFKDAHYGHLSFHQTIGRILKNHDLSKLFAANIILNVFYAWMTIYLPIYLHETMGFNWDSIGIILTVMLLPFPLFQYPAGKLADRGWGEKKIMSLGFALIGLSTCALAFINVKSVLIWAIALFITRIGASITEVMIEAYFFKKVSPENADLLTSFRVTRYGSYIIAPGITAIGLFYNLNTSEMFIVLGLIVLWALRYSLTITDVV
jgi:MFS family permease